MRLTLDIRKSVEENAQRFFEAAKRSRRKAQGAEKAIAEWRLRAAAPVQEERPQAQRRVARRKQWFEKFRWCRSSDGLLLVAGRDATTNEMVIKRHTTPADIVFHTDMAGSPFVVVKAGPDEVPQRTKEEAAQFCASYSRAWRNGMGSLEVFHVAPDQVTKEALPGEYLPKGAFMIRGKTTYHKPLIRVSIGVDAEERIMAGPPDAVAVHCERRIEVFQGSEKTSDVAKEVQRRIGGQLDEIVAALPPGGCRLEKERIRKGGVGTILPEAIRREKSEKK